MNIDNTLIVKISEDKEYDRYNEGDTIDGLLIDTIIGQNKDCFIFLTYDDMDKKYYIMEYTKPTFEVEKYKEKNHMVEKLQSLIDSANFDKNLNYKMTGKLANSYYVSLTNHSSDVESYFFITEKSIKDAAENIKESNHITFISYNILYSFISIAILLIAYICYDYLNHANVLLISIGGILGSMLSIIERNKDVKEVHFQSKKNISLFSFISIILGALSGFIIYWGSEANLLLGNLQDNTSALFILGVAVGTSERYLNSFLKKATNSNLGEDEK